MLHTIIGKLNLSDLNWELAANRDGSLLYVREIGSFNADFTDKISVVLAGSGMYRVTWRRYVYTHDRNPMTGLRKIKEVRFWY